MEPDKKSAAGENFEKSRFKFEKLAKFGVKFHYKFPIFIDFFAPLGAARKKFLKKDFARKAPQAKILRKVGLHVKTFLNLEKINLKENNYYDMEPLRKF